MKYLFTLLLPILLTSNIVSAYIPGDSAFNLKNLASGNYVLNKNGSSNFRTFESINDFVEVCYLGEAEPLILFLETAISSGDIAADAQTDFYLNANGVLAVTVNEVLLVELTRCI